MKAACYLPLLEMDPVVHDDMFIARGPTMWQIKNLRVVVSPRLCLVLQILIVVVSTNLHCYRDRIPPVPHVRYSWGPSLNQRDTELPPYGGSI